jgi:hypothetical protein
MRMGNSSTGRYADAGKVFAFPNLGAGPGRAAMRWQAGGLARQVASALSRPEVRRMAAGADEGRVVDVLAAGGDAVRLERMRQSEARILRGLHVAADRLTPAERDRVRAAAAADRRRPTVADP